MKKTIDFFWPISIHWFAMGAILATGLASQPLGRECKDPKCVAVPLDFTAAVEFTLDTKPLFDNATIDAIVSCYVDNRVNGARLDILISGTLQTISVPAGKQGYFHTLAPNAASFKFTTTGGVLVNAFLLNYDVASATWS